VLDNASLEPPVSNIGASALLDQPAMAPRQARSTRRPVARPVAEPVDYTQDYFHARRDLTRIAIWSVILFAVMIAIRFSGLV
jgi:hypothetical protein